MNREMEPGGRCLKMESIACESAERKKCRRSFSYRDFFYCNPADISCGLLLHLAEGIASETDAKDNDLYTSTE